MFLSNVIGNIFIIYAEDLLNNSIFLYDVSSVCILFSNPHSKSVIVGTPPFARAYLHSIPGIPPKCICFVKTYKSSVCVSKCALLDLRALSVNAYLQSLRHALQV